MRFAVWAPRARRVSVVGGFCRWDGVGCPCDAVVIGRLRALRAGRVRRRALQVRDQDPQRRAAHEDRSWPSRWSGRRAPPPACTQVGTSGRTTRGWRGSAGRIHVAADGDLRGASRLLAASLGGYRELAPALVEHAHRYGFTHVELLPITEHPFDGSWGYQVSGYFAPTARYGSPDDLRAFVDVCHRGGIGVILDWVPAHFPRDDFALRRFDGEPLFEYEDPLLGEHPDWGTLVFDFGRNEVRSFLVASALHWLTSFHLDGLRVDAVASMLYRDYSRREGAWLPNVHGGRENLEAVSFLRQLNDAVAQACPGRLMIAEESTAWPGVTRPTAEGGLGFTFKWNLGWMNDTLRYLARDPIHRRHHQDELTFAAVYEHSEHFVMPLSHDEVVHGKRSLLEKMPGDRWQQLANLRLLLAYQWTRPGKKLLFMGSELAPSQEWSHARALDWGLEADPARSGVGRFLEALGRLYHAHPALWRGDPDPEGFAWIDCTDHAQSVLSYRRRAGDDELVVVLNGTPVPRAPYRIGASRPGPWRVLLDSDALLFGGTGYRPESPLEAEAIPCHGERASLELVLPPLACLVLAPGASS
ncbi:MAG: 1,4-alpha-glucan branching enzyme [Myxococcota bacterium]